VTSVLWRYASARRGALIGADVTDAEVRHITSLTTPNMGFYAGVVIVALIAPQVAAFGYLLIAILAVLRPGGGRTQSPAPA